VHPSFLPVPTGTEAAAFDRAAPARGVPDGVLMESAGRAAADLVQALAGARPPGPVVVLAGAGNNGGDGVVLARTLHTRGIPVLLLVDPRRPDPDPLLHGHDVRVQSLPDAAVAAALLAPDDPPAAVLVDALLGTGLTGAPREPSASWIRALEAEARRSGAPVVALDLPSGVVADTGAVPGPAVRAALTVAFGAPKLGTLLHPGRGCTGRLVAVEIGFPPWGEGDAGAALVTGPWARAHFPFRAAPTHKNEAGRLLLLAGGHEMGGAAILAARAALRAGVGMLRVLTAPEHREAFHRGVPEAILPDVRDPGAVAAALEASDALAAGPGMGLGLGGAPAHLLPGLLEAMAGQAPGPGLLLDADALTLLGRGALPPLPSDPGRRLLTPHPGELARIVEGGGGASPLQDAEAAATRWGAACLLKGTPSVVVAPGQGPALVSASGSSAFARGGMGDVLTGVAGALLARGCDARTAAGLALHLTGRAADEAGSPEALTPSELVEGLPGALRELEEAAPPTAGRSRRREDPGEDRVGAHPALLLDLDPAR
jgi:ADP-dependent NAD(P)H-hydrate dehydratase / NAD(P)H-hydrate epimerase